MKSILTIFLALFIGAQLHAQELPKIPPPPPKPKPKVSVSSKPVTIKAPDKKPLKVTVPKVKVSPPPPKPGSPPKAPPKAPPKLPPPPPKPI